MIHRLERIKAGLILIVVLTFTALTTAVRAQESTENSTNLQLYAQSAILMDAGSGRILYEKNGHEIRPMASTTKIMTCILALEYGSLDDYVDVSSYAAGMPKVKLGVQPGEKYRLKDLLYSLMLESHNDSAAAIAEHIGGSIEGFASMMNQKASDIGCFDTFFITPNGLDATAVTESGETKSHSTTAADLARIMSYCIMDSPKKEEFLTITRTPSYQFSAYKEKDGEMIPNGRNFNCSNHNAFLSMMEGALSGKTGFTGNAGYCYVGSLQRDDRTFVVVLLACGWPNNRTYKWSDTKKLMEYGLDNFEYHSLEEVKIDEDSLNPVLVEGGQTERLGESAYVPVKIVDKEDAENTEGVLLAKNEKFEVKRELKNSLEAPVEEGTQVGTVSYLLNGEVYGVDYIVTTGNIDKIDFKWCLAQILRYYIIC
ncbi:MAG: D-alanyl-D-alanine carboxypeptidase [Lachnospiraceae bacterium]|nr:D-alanyl-D-alanine carboxypeptidase [Lachnospiraceae bacterium]